MTQIKLNNVRLSFPALFRKASFQGAETKYEATFLLDKEDHAELIKKISAAINAKIKSDLKGAKLAPDRICLKDGEHSDYEGYAGCYSIKTGNNKRPTIIDKDRSPLTENDNRIYSGCYVNAIVELWAQDNGFGKRINCNLLGVQFAKDGEPFGDGGKVANANDFDVIDEDDSDFDEDSF